MKNYTRGWFTPARIERVGDGLMVVCIAVVLYMAVTQFAVGCWLLP